MAVSFINNTHFFVIDDNGNTYNVRKSHCLVYYNEPFLAVEYSVYSATNVINFFSTHYSAVTIPTVSSAAQLATELQSYIDTNNVSFSAGTVGDFTVTGATIVNQLTATTISATTVSATTISASNLLSGNTDISLIFAPISVVITTTAGLQTKVSKSGDTMTGQLTTTALSATTLSGGTIYSGSTNLETIITSLIPSPLFSGTTAGGIKQIYPGDSNIANENYSISFGSNNRVYNRFSTILNGTTNIINSNVSNFYYNTILGGKNQTSYNSKYSLVGFGVQNDINGYFSVILGGYGNRIYNSPEYAFLLGNNNKTESSRSFIFGNTNLITGVTNSSILGGRNNKIHKTNVVDNPYNVVINSLQSTILNSSFSNISSGSGNTVYSANFSSIINGQSNKTYSSFSTVVGGMLNTAKTEYSTILGGSGNTTFGVSSIILGGFNNINTTLSSSYSTIINGVDNHISTSLNGYILNKTTKFGTVINGFNNHVLYNYASIINGNSNNINGLYNLIGNGQYNRTNISHVPQTATTVLNGINNSAIHNYATIINGINNFIETTFGFIGNGNFNQVPSQGYYGTVLNGKRNNVQGGHFNQILNGDYSLIAGINIRHNTIINGSRNNIPNNISGTTIVGGSFLTASTNNTLLGDFAQFRSLTGGTTQMVIASTSGFLGVQTIPTGGAGSSVTNGLNTYTGGTSSAPTVNVSALTVNTIVASGASVFSGTFSAITANTSYLKVNTLSGHTTNPERAILYDVQPTSYSNVLVGLASAATYAQLNIRNLNSGTQSSSDIVATADNGTESINYIDMGINSSNFIGYVGAANDGYLYSTGNDLWIGNVTSNKSIKLFTDGTGNTNVRITINSGGTQVNTLSANTIYSGTTLLSTIMFQSTMRLLALGI